MKHTFVTVIAICIAHFLGYASGCASASKAFDDVNNPSDDVRLSECRKDARAEMQITGNADRAWKIYYDCTVDAGLR